MRVKNFLLAISAYMVYTRNCQRKERMTKQLDIRKSSSGLGVIPYRRYSPRPAVIGRLVCLGIGGSMDGENRVIDMTAADLVKFQNRQ